MEQKTKRDDRYVQFPLCLVQGTFPERYDHLNIMLDYGIIKYAKSFKCDLIEVARQLMYAYYRNEDMIQMSLYKMFKDYLDDGALTTDEDYNGFSGASFYPDDSINELLTLFKSNPEFKEASIFRYQIAQAVSFLNIRLHNIDHTLKKYNEGLSAKNIFESSYGPDCFPNIKPLHLIDFRDSRKDIDLLRAYIGIRSLIGQNNYVSTHKTVILSRMMGCKSNDSLNAFLKNNKTAKETYEKYSSRKRMDNLLYKLMERGFIIMLSKKHESRIYLSAKLKTPSELADAILRNRKQNDLKKQIAEASKLL